MTSLAIIQLVLFLLVALFSPFLTPPKRNQWLLLLVLIVNTSISAVLLLHIESSGPITLLLGGHQRGLGIELLIDAFSVLFTLFLGALGSVVQIYALGFMKTHIAKAQHTAYSGLMAILFFAIFGLLYTNDLFNTYVLIEILSIATVALISIVRKKRNFMAALRYLLISELASLSVLFGIALIYMVTGTLNMTLIYEAMPRAFANYPINVTLALGFMGMGLAIKTAIFPFHEWLPDAYTSAPSSSSAILSALVSKAYMVVLIKILFRVFGSAIIEQLGAQWVMITLAAVAMIVGSLFALGQTSFKRMLAYSSVAQVGYLLLALSLLSRAGLEAMLFYMISHALIKGTLFLVAGSFSTQHIKDSLKALSGVAYVAPFTALVLGVGAFGMVGIPGTSGFIAKFHLAMALGDASRWGFVVLIMLSSILNAIYFFPVIINSIVKQTGTVPLKRDHLPISMVLSMSVLLIAIVTLGFSPSLVLPYIEAAVTAIGF